MKTILITGGAGYIGSHAVKLFLEKNYKVVVLDNLSRGYKKPLEILSKFGELTFEKADLRNKDEVNAVFGKYNFESVLHFAALCLVNESVEKPELYFENNVFGSFNLLEAMRTHDVKKIVFSSTCATYGETVYLPVDENHPQNPANPYGESKLMVEKMLKWYGAAHGFKYSILRYFNVCGAEPSGIIGDSKKPSVLLVQNAVRGALYIEPFKYTCPKVNTSDGTPIRDYIDVNDLVSAHFMALEFINNNQSEVFNLGNGVGYSVKEIVKKVEEILNVSIPEEHTEPRQGEYAKIYANPEKAKNILNFETKVTLDESINSLKNWYTKYPNGYEY